MAHHQTPQAVIRKARLDLEAVRDLLFRDLGEAIPLRQDLRAQGRTHGMDHQREASGRNQCDDQRPA